MRLVVTGAAGLLGGYLMQQARSGEVFDEVVGLDLADGDLTDASWTRHALAGADVVIHGAAWTDVDGAEAAEDKAYAVNATASANVADACSATGARLLAVSTDYVFAGTAADGGLRTIPYDIDDEPDPRSAYGRTKLAGEREILGRRVRATIVRTAWVYDGGRGFVATMRRLERERDTVEVVDDQFGSPTYASDLAGGLLALAARDDVDARLLHLTNAGTTTWYGLAQEVFRLVGADPERVRPVSTEAFPRPAPRPAWSVLSPRAWLATGLQPLRPWQEALRAAVGAA